MMRATAAVVWWYAPQRVVKLRRTRRLAGIVAMHPLRCFIPPEDFLSLAADWPVVPVGDRRPRTACTNAAGCSDMQGLLFGSPRPASEINRIVETDGARIVA